MSKLMGKIHSIETFGTVDGPGVRFVVFFQGCPMRCLYCHNPDTWQTGVGEELEAEEVLSRMERNLPFYKTGGITATGGEPLMQMDFLIELFEKAKAKGIHTCLDTSGILFDKTDENKMRHIDRLLLSTDLVMLDIKHIDKAEHKVLTGIGNDAPLGFARYLEECGKPMRIRHVVVPTITDKEESLRSLGRFLREFENIEKVELLPYHNMGKVKYEALGLNYPLNDTRVADAKDIERAYAILNEAMGKNA